MSLNRLQDTLNNYQILCKTCINIRDVELINFSPLVLDNISYPDSIEVGETTAEQQSIVFEEDLSFLDKQNERELNENKFDDEIEAPISIGRSKNKFINSGSDVESKKHHKKRSKQKQSHFGYYLLGGLLISIIILTTVLFFDFFNPKTPTPTPTPTPRI